MMWEMLKKSTAFDVAIVIHKLSLYLIFRWLIAAI